MQNTQIKYARYVLMSS